MPDYSKQEKAQGLALPGLLLCIIWIHLILLPTGIIAYADFNCKIQKNDFLPPGGGAPGVFYLEENDYD